MYPVSCALLVRRLNSHDSSTLLSKGHPIHYGPIQPLYRYNVPHCCRFETRRWRARHDRQDSRCLLYDEAADELLDLQQDLEQLQTQMVSVHRIPKVLASNTGDRGFQKLLQK